MTIKEYKFNEYECMPGLLCIGFTKLMIDITEGKPLKKIKNINATNSLGYTALMLACLKSRELGNDNVKILLENKADPNISNKFGITPLIQAVKNCGTLSTEETVKILLDDPRTDPNLQTRLGFTALIYASMNKLYGEKMVELILQHLRIDPNIRTNHGYTALIEACDSNARECNPNIVRKLLKHERTDPNVKDKDRWTALTYACCYSKLNQMEDLIVKILLSHPLIDPNVRDENGDTILMLISDLYVDTSSIGTTNLLHEHPLINIELRNYDQESFNILYPKNKTYEIDHNLDIGNEPYNDNHSINIHDTYPTFKNSYDILEEDSEK